MQDPERRDLFVRRLSPGPIFALIRRDPGEETIYRESDNRVLEPRQQLNEAGCVTPSLHSEIPAGQLDRFGDFILGSERDGDQVIGLRVLSNEL